MSPQGAGPGARSPSPSTRAAPTCRMRPLSSNCAGAPRARGCSSSTTFWKSGGGAAKGTTTTPSTFPRGHPSPFSPTGKDTEVIHGLPAGVDQASHSAARLLGGQPGQRPPGGAVVEEQAGPLQQQLLVHAVGQQPQRHLEEPVPAQVGEPAQAGDEVTPRAAAAGTAGVTGRRSCRSPPPKFPVPRAHSPPGLQPVELLHQGRHADGGVPDGFLWG